jgi:peptidoglycan/LPS O-acetylase OafA/YrhL
VRGYALLVGIVYHATMSFLPGRPIWVVEDTHRSLLLSGLFFLSHTFRMTTFFLIAGFFAHMMVEKRGVKGFVKDRAKRILVPLLVGWPIIFAAIIAASVYGAYVMTGHIPKPPPPNPQAPALAFPLTHLWFLYLLLILYGLTLGCRALVLRLDRSGRFRRRADAALASIVESPLAPLALAVPSTLALSFVGPWAKWFGVPTPDNSLLPNIPALVSYFTAFGFGWLLHRQPGLINSWTRRWPLNLALALGFTALCLSMAGVAPLMALEPLGPQRTLFAGVYSLATWTWTFAVVGMALRFLSNHSPVRRYIADSSYWLYLIHLPIVMALQAAVAKLDWPAEVKILLVLGVAFPLMFASYQFLVRRSFVGAILNGRRAPKAAAEAPPQLAPLARETFQ